jgi:hypothetical protein
MSTNKNLQTQCYCENIVSVALLLFLSNVKKIVIFRKYKSLSFQGFSNLI